jgi:hypothetical protein
LTFNPESVPREPVDRSTFHAGRGSVKENIVKLFDCDVYETVIWPTPFGDRTNSIVPDVGWTTVTNPFTPEKDTVANIAGQAVPLGVYP